MPLPIMQTLAGSGEGEADDSSRSSVNTSAIRGFFVILPIPLGLVFPLVELYTHPHSTHTETIEKPAQKTLGLVNIVFSLFLDS